MVSGVSYAEMIKSAISSLDEREGSTRISIANFILESFDVNNCHEAAVKTKMRQNLRRMVIFFLHFYNGAFINSRFSRSFTARGVSSRDPTRV